MFTWAPKKRPASHFEEEENDEQSEDDEDGNSNIATTLDYDEHGCRILNDNPRKRKQNTLQVS